MLGLKIDFENLDLTEKIQASLQNNGVKFSQVEFLRYSVNKNFKVTAADETYFLRVYRPGKETLEQILAEHDFLSFLKQNEFRSAGPKRLPTGSSVGTIRLSSEVEFYFALFDFVRGNHPTDLPAFALEWGRCLGQLHSLSRQYQKSDGIPERRLWNEASWVLNSEELLKSVVPADRITLLLRERDQVLNYLSRLSRTDEEFGLVHYDFHQGNILIEDGKPRFLDFDDCCRHWFVWDFALPMHRLGGAYMSNQGIEQKARFIEGYRQANSLSKEQENQIRTFERVRHLFMICWLAERATETKWRDIVPKYVRAHAEYLSQYPDLLGT